MNRIQGSTWWRRRFLRIALVISGLWILSGVAFAAFGGFRGGDGDGDGRGGFSGPPVAFVAVAAAVVATWIAYRRLARPVSDLLDGAGRIGAGNYDARVQPSGPRAVRTLGTAFNDMARRLDASEDSRRRFLADVTHELRTPLAVLQAEVEAQLDGVHPRDDAHLTTLLDQTRTLGRLVEDLRTLALGEAGRLDLHPEPISMATMATDAAAAMARTAEGRAVTVVLDVPDDVEIDADPVRIGQVLTNLVSNAIRHTPPGGTVTIAVRSEVEHVRVSVADTGAGLGTDPERVFDDRFTRAADSGGSGLGLSIARQLVEAHGGGLTARNAPTGGAVFEFTLPRHG